MKKGVGGWKAGEDVCEIQFYKGSGFHRCLLSTTYIRGSTEDSGGGEVWGFPEE